MASGATKRDKVILAYSGGLDTSVMVPWIGEKYNLDVVAFTADLGQGEDIERIRQKALRPAPWTPWPWTPATCSSIVSSFLP